MVSWLLNISLSSVYIIIIVKFLRLSFQVIWHLWIYRVFSDQEDHHSIGLFSNDVIITPSSGGHDHASSKVKVKNIVDYAWQHNYYVGQLLAVHMNGKYLAYGIKGGILNRNYLMS